MTVFCCGAILLTMKLITILFFILAFSHAQAEETHSPWLKCMDNGEEVMVMRGNEFPQIPDLDWSQEVAIIPSEDYYNGWDKDDIYLINPRAIELLKTFPRKDGDFKETIIISDKLELTTRRTDQRCFLKFMCVEETTIQCEHFFND